MKNFTNNTIKFISVFEYDTEIIYRKKIGLISVNSFFFVMDSIPCNYKLNNNIYSLYK